MRPNQVWSWDITWLPTNVRGIYLHLYLMMDVWSRRIVGWRIADGDSARIAADLITQACRDGNVDPRGLVLHSDNGKPMRASTTPPCNGSASCHPSVARTSRTIIRTPKLCSGP